MSDTTKIFDGLDDVLDKVERESRERHGVTPHTGTVAALARVEYLLRELLYRTSSE